VKIDGGLMAQAAQEVAALTEDAPPAKGQGQVDVDVGLDGVTAAAEVGVGKGWSIGGWFKRRWTGAMGAAATISWRPKPKS
jgi:hypothetical protein